MLNASFKCQQALRPLNAVLTILQNTATFGNVQGPLFTLARDELLDAISVLSAVSGLNTAAQTNLQSANPNIAAAFNATTVAARVTAAQAAVALVNSANASFTASGTSAIALRVGAGTLLF